MPVWVKYIGLAVLGYAAYCTLVFAFQRQMIFPRSLIGYAPVALPDNLPIEKIWLTIPGASVESWYIPPTGGPTNGRRPALIFAHGNAERIDVCTGELIPFTALGIGVLLVEYPGYGQSTGTPSQKSVRQLLFSVAGNNRNRSMVGSNRFICFRYIETHFVQLIKEVVGKLDIRFIDFVDKQYYLVRRSKSLTQLSQFYILLDIGNILISKAAVI